MRWTQRIQLVAVRACCHQMTGWFHTNHIGLSPTPMTGMLLDFQMPAGINRYRTHADLANAGSDTLQLNAAPSRLSLFALDPANTARGCRACCHSDDPGWSSTLNRIGLSPAPMTGMLLDFQMPAGINGIERMPTTTQDQTLYAAECSTQPAELKYSRPASRCVITKNNTQTANSQAAKLSPSRKPCHCCASSQCQG